MSRLSSEQSKSLLRVIARTGNCGDVDVDMTPSAPLESERSNPEAKEAYRLAKKAAAQVCQECVAAEACFVYSVDEGVPPVFAANLSDNEKRDLRSIMLHSSLIDRFVTEQLVVLETKRTSD